MITKMKFLIGFSLLFASFAFADQMGPNGDKFYEEAARFENACSQGSCNQPYHKVLVYDAKVQRPLPVKILPTLFSLRAIAMEQAQLWGDTILEGDYIASGGTRLDLVFAFYKNNELVGYKIQYSERSWYTGNCAYDGTQASLAGCQEGRIAEVSYASPDMLTFFSDEEKYADFSVKEISLLR